MKKAVLFVVMIIIPCMIMYGHNIHSSKSKRVVLVFIPQVDGIPLKLESQEYTTANGDSFYVDLFKFYVSNIHIRGTGFSAKDDYHLIDASDSSTCRIVYNEISLSSLTGLDFILGVDSAINISGAMGGDLDPAKGMYWAWNSGYIMAKLEGRSPACKTIHHSFEFHVGGYKAPYNTARKIALKINKTVPNDAQTVTIYITTNVNEWFRTPTTIRLGETNEVSLPGAKASMMADNYADMFSISSVEIK